MYRVSEEEMLSQQREYKKKYNPFAPYKPSSEDLTHIARHLVYLLRTQNGQDVDDYSVTDANKIQLYLRDVPHAAEVLLLGVGSGREVLVAKDLGLHAQGTTLGSRNIDFGRSELGLLPEEHRECLNEALPFPSETFDVVMGIQVFEHAIAPLVFLLEQYRVLKDGGKLILEWPPAEGYSMADNPHHQICYTPGQAKALFEKASFTDIKLYYEDLSEVEQDCMWRGDQKKMICIEGIKATSSKEYINDVRRMRR